MKWTTLFLVMFFVSVFPCLGQDKELTTVTGRVTNLSGDAADGVEVKFFALDGIRGNSKTETLVRTGITDKDGNYKMEGIPWGAVSCRI